MGIRTKKLAFIPVRGGSKSIPKKNIKVIFGKPLVYWVIDAALESEVFDEIVISTDDHEIEKVIKNHSQSDKLRIVIRSKETASDTATTESAMIEFSKSNKFDQIALLQATSPLITGEQIRQAFDMLSEDDNANSLVSVCRQKRFIWQKKVDKYFNPINYNPQNRPRRQDFEGFLVENGALYFADRNDLLQSGCRLSGNILCYEMPPDTYFEIDDPEDWTIIDSFLSRKKAVKNEDILKNTKVLLTDVDGVLTDAGMYYSENGDELKKFNTRDGKGIELLKKNGIEVGIITSEDTQIVSKRAKKLKVDFLYQGVRDKGKILDEIIQERNILPEEVVYIGDDINDLSILEKVGFSTCPLDAMNVIREKVDYICTFKGGEGCLREVADLILRHFVKDDE